VTGGELTGGLVHGLGAGPGTVLFVAAGLLLATIPLVAGIRRYHEAHGVSAQAQEAPSGDGSSGSRDADSVDGEQGEWATLQQTLRTYPLVGWIAAIVALVSMVSTVLDYQLKTIAAASFAGEADLTAFLGRFYGRVSLVAFVLQLALSTGLRRYVRTTTALWILPLAIALGTTALLVVPGLLTVTLLRGSDQALKHSIDKTGRELLFLPLPQAVKRRLKVPLDLIIDQVAYGVGGLLLIGLVSWAGLSAVALGPVVFVLVALWMGALIGAHRQYLQQFRATLRGAVPSLQSLPTESPSETAASLLGLPHVPEGNSGSRTSGAAGRETAIQHGARYVLLSQLLALRTGAEPPTDETVACSALPAEPELRSRRQAALNALFDVLADWLPEVQEADAADLQLALEGLHHSSPDVRSDAVAFLDGLLTGSIRRRLVPLLDDPDGRLALKNAPPLYRFSVSDRAGAIRRSAAPPPTSQALPDDKPGLLLIPHQLKNASTSG
jgi:hypothetical protein